MANHVHAPFDTLHERIRLRAYRLYEHRLREGQSGDALGDWLHAEAEVLAIGKPHTADAGAVRIEPKPDAAPAPTRQPAVMSRR